ncbi:MAG: polyprenol phosphomannose-dependent alpha 1,6 mannosyltransferase MptB [Candidatus Dormibacteria bacterium]
MTGTIGLFGSVCILIGVARSDSPFTSKLPGAWFFGLGSGAGSAGSNHDGTFLGIMLVYAGVALMIGSWFEMVRTVRRHPGAPLRPMVTILVAWVVPVLVVPPLFSRDVYSYAAQGEMVRQGINPYAHGPSALGPGRFLSLVDPLWRTAPAPYGPAWERLSGGIVQLARQDVLAAIVGFRLVALVGVVLIAWGIPVLARSVGRDQTVAFTLAVLNPVVLLVLLGGAHNDALMLGFLVAGCAVARRHHVLAGLMLCALAAEILIPALIGLVFIGWWWSDDAASWRQRIPRVAAAVLIGIGLMAAISAICGLGWSWVSALSNPGVVVSWLDPATAVGLSLGHVANLLGFGGHSAAFVQGSRAMGIGIATVVSVGLILRSNRAGAMQALGWSLLVFVVLGPVVWPWYETWGFVFLAVIAEGWTLRLLFGLSALACFADIPSARFFEGTDLALAVICWIGLLGAIIAYAVIRLVPSLPRHSARNSPTPTPTESESTLA